MGGSETATGDLSHLGGQGCSRQGSCQTARAETSSGTLGTALCPPHGHLHPQKSAPPRPLPPPLNPPGPWRKQLKPGKLGEGGALGGHPAAGSICAPECPV